MSASDEAESEGLADEFQRMVQQAIDNLGAHKDPAVLGLAELIVETVLEYQAKTPTLSADRIGIAIRLAIQSLEKTAQS